LATDRRKSHMNSVERKKQVRNGGEKSMNTELGKGGSTFNLKQRGAEKEKRRGPSGGSATLPPRTRGGGKKAREEKCGAGG